MLAKIKEKLLQAPKSGNGISRALYLIRKIGVRSKILLEALKAFIFFSNKKLDNYYPDFLGAGMQKSATSWVDKMLRKHSQIRMPYKRKEIHFFDKFKRWGYKWYAYNFRKANQNQIKGEITPSYSILDVSQIETIYKLNPDLKVFFILRDPIERAWSQIYMTKVRHRGRELSDFPVCEYLNLIDAKGYEERSNYLKILNNWKSVFPESQIHIEFYESVKNEPKELLNRIFTFIGAKKIDNFDSFGIDQKVNENKKVEMPLEVYNRLLEKFHIPLQELQNEIDHPIIKNWINKYY